MAARPSPSIYARSGRGLAVLALLVCVDCGPTTIAECVAACGCLGVRDFSPRQVGFPSACTCFTNLDGARCQPDTGAH